MSDDRDDGAWRDEERLRLAELGRAMATYSQEGQADDVTGNDAGQEAAFGHGATARGVAADDEDDPTSAAQRRLRPSFEGRTGPN